MKNFKSTEEINVSDSVIDQVVGQEKAVETVKKAAQQRRHVFLIGEPGTGKSMLGVALSELLPKEELKDIVAFPNQNDENQPLMRVLPAGKGRELVQRTKMESMNMFKGQNIILLILLVLFLFVAPWWAFYHYGDPGNVIEPFLGSTKEPINGNPLLGGLMFFTFTIAGLLFFASYIFIMNLGKRMAGSQ
ncbi:MAG: ATP-binding protein, partial [Nanobdellota archaeon]